MTKSRAPTFNMETVDGRTLRVAVWRAENVGEQGTPTNGSRAGAVCFGVRGKG
jgi:hypothetical protein